MLKPATRTDRPRPRPPLQPSVTPLVDWALELAPRALRTASEDHGAALARLAEARHEQRVANDGLDAAAAVDRAAAEHAFANGEPVPDASYPAAVAARSRAGRAVEAAEQIARGTQHDYVTALHEHREDFASALHGAHIALHEEGVPLVNELERVLTTLRGVRHLAAELEHLRGSSPGSRVQMFEGGDSTTRRGRDSLQGSLRGTLETLSRALAAEAPDDPVIVTRRAA